MDALTVDQVEAYSLLRDLAERCPRPQRWHAGAEHVAEVFADLEVAVEAIGAVAAAAAAFALELDRQPDPASATAASGSRLAAAHARLASLPSPEGQHPFVDVIRPTLEALAAALAALARVPEAAALFERRRPEVRVVLEDGPRPDAAPWAATG